MEVSFGSTYRIEITQPGVNKAKKERLRALTTKYEGLISSGDTGTARVSILNSQDDAFEKDLKDIGYKQYQKFDAENLPQTEIDRYIKSKLDTRDYTQKGKQKKHE